LQARGAWQSPKKDKLKFRNTHLFFPQVFLPAGVYSGKGVENQNIKERMVIINEKN